MPKTIIKNRSNLDLAVFYTLAPAPSRGIIFIEHGFTGHHNETQIQTIADTFFQAGYTTVLFDASNATGESGDDAGGPTLDTHLNDLKDVIGWAKGQSWYLEPFMICGQSLGAASAFIYATEFPQEISMLFPVSPLLDGKDMFEAMKKQMGDAFTNWQQGGFYERKSSTTGKIIRVPFSFMTSILSYSAMQYIDKIKCPVHIAVGGKDEVTPQERVRQFYQNLNCRKSLHILDDCKHIFHKEEDIKTLQKCFLEIIKNI